MDLRRCDRTRAKISPPGRETLNQEQVFEDLYVGVTGSRFEAGVASGGPDVEHLAGLAGKACQKFREHSPVAEFAEFSGVALRPRRWPWSRSMIRAPPRRPAR